MKKILFFLGLLIASFNFVSAQATYQLVNGKFEWQWGKTDSSQIIPRYHTVGRPSASPQGQIIYNIDSVKLQYSDGSNWHSIDGLLSGSVGATNINVGAGYRIGIAVTTNIKTLGTNFAIILDSLTANELHISVDSSKVATTFKLSLKVNIADTAAMLLPYLRKADTTLMLSKYLRKSDTTAMLAPYLRKSDTAASFARFVKYTDTSLMLTPYLRKSDTTAMLVKYLRRSDTTAMLLPYLRKSDTTAMLLPYARSVLVVKYTDTALMLSKYLRKTDTTAMLSVYLRKSDTTAMLLPYLRKSDTTLMLSKYLRFSDTTAMLSKYLRKSDTAAMLLPYARSVLVVKYTDTANMLLPYLRKSDTTLMLSKYLRRSDTTAMLSVYLRKSDTTAMLLPYLRSSVAAATYATITNLNLKVDSIKRTPGNDSVFYWHNGVKVFAFLDSAGGAGGGAIASINGLTNSAITFVTGTSPGTDFNIATTAPGTIRLIIPSSSAVNRGLLTAADWTTFNNKQNALAFGSLTETTSSVLTITGGTNAVVGAGVGIQVKQGSSTQNGFITSADWNTFNAKGNGTVTNVTGIFPIGVATGTTTPVISLNFNGLPSSYYKNGLHVRNDSTAVLGGSLDSAVRFSGHNSFAITFDSSNLFLTGSQWVTPAGLDTVNYKLLVRNISNGLLAVMRWPVSGGGGTPTLQQVLTAGSTLTNGYIIQSSGLTNIGGNFLNITSDMNSATLKVDNTLAIGNGNSAVFATNNSPIFGAVSGFNNGTGFGGSFTGGTGVVGNGNGTGSVGGSFNGNGTSSQGVSAGARGLNAVPATFAQVDSTANNVATMISLGRAFITSPFTGQNGHGEAIDFNLVNSGGSNFKSQIIIKATDVNSGSQTSQFSIKLFNSAVSTTAWTLDGNGNVTTIGGKIVATREVTGSVININNTDEVVIFYGTASTINAFPTPVHGQKIHLVNHSAGGITCPSVTTANGTTSTSIPAGQTYVIDYDSTNSVWQKIN